MRSNSNTWAVVLAGGDGSRLKEVTTTPEGDRIPKQFCSLNRRACLLEDAIERARAISLPQHICSVVAVQHRRWWTAPLSRLPAQNIFVQPANRGTANGILLALLQIEARSSDAIVVLLPADHYIGDEFTMSHSLRVAANVASDNRDLVYLLGAEPDSPDEELGYIVPTERRRDSPAGVLRFLEKPSSGEAQQLLAQGALWNTFIISSSVHALLSLFNEKLASTVTAMRQALALANGGEVGFGALEALYDNLEPLDFSRDVLQRREQTLRVVRLPSCGWTDLGTLKRVQSTVHALQRGASTGGAEALYLDLATLHRARVPDRSAQPSRPEGLVSVDDRIAEIGRKALESARALEDAQRLDREARIRDKQRIT
jgi:mannose-1-phosphate guanylyltransferase